MDDMKGKMKNLMKKVNKPFSSSSAFKGQSHILGSSTLTPPNSSSSRLLPPPPQPTTNKSASAADTVESPANCVSRFLSGQPAEASVEIMIRLLRNVAQEPDNEKYRKIRMGNPRIKEAIGDVMGGVELLECAGFRMEEEDGERWARMGELTRERIAAIEDAVLLMERWKGKENDEVGVGNGGAGRLDGEEGEEREVKAIDRKVV